MLSPWNESLRCKESRTSFCNGSVCECELIAMPEVKVNIILCYRLLCDFSTNLDERGL